MEELTQEERETIAYLLRGLIMYASQVAAMLDPVDYKWARREVAERGNAVIEVIQEVQTILKNKGE